MKAALKKIFTFFVELFKSKDMKTEIYTILLGNLDCPELKELRDADIMNRAWELVKALHVRTDLTGTEKARIFNEQLAKWGAKIGKVIGVMALNIVREVAYAALKIAITKGLVTLLLADGRRVTADTVTCVEEPEQPLLPGFDTIDVGES